MWLDIIIALVLFGGGYAASIFTWPKVRTIIGGVEREIERRRDQLIKIQNRLKG